MPPETIVEPTAQPQPTPAAQPASPVSTVKPASILSDAGKTPAADASKDGKSILDGAKAEGQDPAKTDAPQAEKPAVPEKYEIKAPEGMTIDESILEKFTPIAKELGLSNEQVQKLAEFQATQITEAQKAQESNFTKFVDDTKAESIKFFGDKLQAELPYIAKGRDAFASSEVMDLLEKTGLSNHKAVLSMFAKLGRTVSEDKLVDGKGKLPQNTKTDGQIIYGPDN